MIAPSRMILSKPVCHLLLLGNLIGADLLFGYAFFHLQERFFQALLIGSSILCTVAALMVLCDVIRGSYSLDTTRIHFVRGWTFTFLIIFFCYWAVSRSY